MAIRRTSRDLAPRTLFLLDGLRALLSAFFLGIVLVRFEATFGMPRRALYMLALLPCGFALVDAIGYRAPRARRGRYLRGIGFANVGYSCLSLTLVGWHHGRLTELGLAYFAGELAVVVWLAVVELRVGSAWVARERSRESGPKQG